MNYNIIRRLSPFFILLGFIAIAVLLVKTKTVPEKKSEAEKVPIVDVMEITQQTVSLNIPSYGVVTPKSSAQLVIEVQGKIITLSDQFVAGGIVKKEEPLAQIDPTDYQADLMQAQAALAQAKAALDEELARGEVAKIEFKGYNKGKAPALGLRIPQRQKEEANVQYAEAALARAERNLERTVIRAPFDGIIKARAVDLGQYVSLGTTLGELYGTETAEIRLPVTNDDLAYLDSIKHPHTEVMLSGSLAGQKTIWKGEVVRSEGVIDTENRMLYLVAEVKDPYRLNASETDRTPLKYGSFVNATIKGRTVTGIAVVPRHLVRNNEVTIVNDDSTLALRKVNIVQRDVNYFFIQDSLKTGERVVINGLNNMVEGQTVKVLGEEIITAESIQGASPEANVVLQGVQ